MAKHLPYRVPFPAFVADHTTLILLLDWVVSATDGLSIGRYELPFVEHPMLTEEEIRLAAEELLEILEDDSFFDFDSPQ